MTTLNYKSMLLFIAVLSLKYLGTLEKKKISMLFILEYETKWTPADLTVPKEILFIMYLQLLD